MRVNVGTYADFKALVNDIGVPESVSYVADGTTVTCALAVFLTHNVAVICGGVANSINVTTATLIGDYAAAVQLQTSPSVIP